MNKYLSDKLRIISFISIIMVVFIHTINTTVKFNSGNIFSTPHSLDHRDSFLS
jgi:hypothetical protein